MNMTVSDPKNNFTEYSKLRYRIEAVADLAMAAAEEAGRVDADLDSPLSWAEKVLEADRIWSGLIAGIGSLDRLDH